MKEKDYMSERDQNYFLYKRALQRMSGALNQLRPIVEWNDLHAPREPALKRLYLLLNTFYYI